MSGQATIIFTTIVVSWVIFIFNFVLGYYMGRSVEAAERIKNAAKEENKNESTNSSKK